MTEINPILKKLNSGQDLVIQINFLDGLEICSNFLAQKIKSDLYKLIPRALVFCNDINKCEQIEQRIVSLANDRDLKVVVIHDKANSVKQRNVLYEGVDIVIGNPKRITELYYQNGINLKEVHYFILLESEILAKLNQLNLISRLLESTKKCQRILLYEVENEKLIDFVNSELKSPIIL